MRPDRAAHRRLGGVSAAPRYGPRRPAGKLRVGNLSCIMVGELAMSLAGLVAAGILSHEQGHLMALIEIIEIQGPAPRP
jgi:hypothetical protein